jgi:hypothetical protein
MIRLHVEEKLYKKDTLLSRIQMKASTCFVSTIDEVTSEILYKNKYSEDCLSEDLLVKFFNIESYGIIPTKDDLEEIRKFKILRNNDSSRLLNMIKPLYSGVLNATWEDNSLSKLSILFQPVFRLLVD